MKEKVAITLIVDLYYATIQVCTSPDALIVYLFIDSLVVYSVKTKYPRRKCYKIMRSIY